MENLKKPLEKSPAQFLVLVILIVITRLPLLFHGYGWDGDAWRVAWSAYVFWHEGVYIPSRFPGFPLYEFFNAPLVGIGGYLLSNAVTLLIFLAAVLTFRKILTIIRIPRVDILVWTFAFLPILWKNSAITLDYILGLTLILVSYLLLLRRSYGIAGLCLGLAAGTRITHLAFLIPMFFQLEGGEKWKQFMRMSAAAVGVTVISYLPVVLRAEFPGEVREYITDVRIYSAYRHVGNFLYRWVYAFGLPGMVFIALLLHLSRHRFVECWRSRDRSFRTSLAAVGTMLFAFFLLPDEREYLIPLIPFAFIVFGFIVVRKTYLITAGICLFSYNVVNVDVIVHGFGRQRIAPAVAEGMVVRDFRLRTIYHEWRAAVSTVQVPDSSIVMIARGASFWMDNPLVAYESRSMESFGSRDVSRSRLRPHVYYVYALPYDRMKEYRSKGYAVFYLSDAKGYLESFLRYDLDTAGVRSIEVPALE